MIYMKGLLPRVAVFLGLVTEVFLRPGRAFQVRRARERSSSKRSDGEEAPRRHWCAKVEALKHHSKEASVAEVSMIGLDIAKQVFQVHGADASGPAVFRGKIVPAKLMEFFSSQPRCLVALEVCNGAYYWGRQIAELGHRVRLIPPAYVKPFVKW